MSGRCKYCKKKLDDVANIRCDACDAVFQDGLKLGKEMTQEKVRECLLPLLVMAKVVR